MFWNNFILAFDPSDLCGDKTSVYCFVDGQIFDNVSEKSDKVNIKVINSRKVTEEGRKVFDQMKEQAEYVEYEEFCD